MLFLEACLFLNSSMGHGLVGLLLSIHVYVHVCVYFLPQKSHSLTVGREKENQLSFKPACACNPITVHL